MSVTLSQLRSTFYDILREEEGTSAYPYSLVDLLLNSSQQRICAGVIVNPLSKETVTKGQLPFLNTDSYYSNVAPTSLSADTSIGATSLTVGTASNFPSSGNLMLGGNLLTYTGTTATSFTGVTGVLFAFESGQEVSVAFALPSDFASALNVVYNNKFKLPGKSYDDIYEDLNKFKGSNYARNRTRNMYESPYQIQPFYSIKDNGYIVIYNINDTDGIIRFRYEKIASEMTATTDTATISNDIYAKTTIPYLAVGEMLYNRGEEQRAAEILNFGMGQVKEMFTYYNNTTFEKISGTQYKMGKGRYLNI